jgi:PAS domain S-box-containing protein
METTKLKILFFHLTDPDVATLAAGILAVSNRADIEGTAVIAGQGKVSTEVGAVAQEKDIKIVEVKTLSELGISPFDVVVTLSAESLQYCDLSLSGGEEGPKSPLFIGSPLYLHWPLLENETEADRSEELRGFRHALEDYMHAFTSHGYASAILAQRKELLEILDRLEEGVVVHDSRRIIFRFNKAMERITGLGAEEVLGRDCHVVFSSEGLCGGECRFRELPSEPSQKGDYSIRFLDAQGRSRRLHVISKPVTLGPAKSFGIMATVRDLTEVSDLRWKLGKKRSFHGIVGKSSVIKEVFEIVRQVSISDYPVLITGDSGTGKELVAVAIHEESRRKGGPFVPINCGALPENILESELFGHVRGAFTGAIRDKKGRFELAHGGTIFFDEVSELSPAFQVKLLRVLEEKRFELVGSERTISVDVRVISATNRSLRDMVAKGEFREDLFYRLAVVPVFLPPLRKRREDIPLIIDTILNNIRKEMGSDKKDLSDETMNCLMSYPWPGNVRELINALQYAAVRCREAVIRPNHLPPEVSLALSPGFSFAPASHPTKPRRGKLARVEVEEALRETGGNKLQAARILGVGRATLYRFLNDNPVS